LGVGVGFGFGGAGSGAGSVGVGTVVGGGSSANAEGAARPNVSPAAVHKNTALNAKARRRRDTFFLLAQIRPQPILGIVDRNRDDTRAPTLAPMAPKGEQLIVDNRRARHDYHLLDRVEAGLVLTGTEVKSLRDGRASLQQAYADVRDGEAWLVGAHISVYDQGNLANHDPDRDRKLLLHKKELESLAGKVSQKGLTVVPTRLYFKNGRAKVELALARGKEGRDKRRDIAKREADRDMQRALKSRR
jgi:SsrA-binding protein